MGAFVLDSFALIAYFRDEPLYMCEVNFAETKYMIIRKHEKSAWETTANLLSSIPIQFFSADRSLSNIASQFKSKHSISLADAFAAALAKAKRAHLVIGDPEFKSLEKEINIKWLT